MVAQTRLIAQTILFLALCAFLPFTGMAAGASEPQGKLFESHDQTQGHFVIADFDGDHNPDFATVHIDQTFIHLTNYSIHLELSQGLESEIGLTAPSGGLQLITRDVNGDDSLDLVVRTAFSSNLVAVFLNDGHGKFTLAEPEFARSAQNEPVNRLNPSVPHRLERVLLLPSRSSLGDLAETEFSRRVRTICGTVPGSKGCLLFELFGVFPVRARASETILGLPFIFNI